ncbi:MAG: FtsX-like permease family protein [Candidatus Bathyarchaeia archaeon]
MRVRKGLGLFACLLFAFFTLAPLVEQVFSQTGEANIYGRVIDAIDGKPISSATVLVWDLSDPSANPRTGSGVYKTDEDGFYLASHPYVRMGHYYRIYAFRGDPPTGPFDYMPSQPVTFKFEGEDKNVSFRLVKAASLWLEGDIMYVEAASTPYRTSITVVDPYEGKPPVLYNASYVSTYWASTDSWFLGLADRLVLIPANTKVFLRADSRFQIGSYLRSLSFSIDNHTEGFMLPPGSMQNVSIWEYPLRRSIDIVRETYFNTLQSVEKSSRSGFIVFEEKSRMDFASRKILESQELIFSDPKKSWFAMREAYMEALAVENTLGFMKLAAATEAVRLPIFISVLAVTLGFFSFEDIRRKLLSSIFFYALFIATTFFVYPGTATFTMDDIKNFVLSAIGSFALTSIIVFILPRIWKEPEVEGEVSLRSAMTMIFSMSKREIRRRKNRSVFTLISLCIMVMTFTALTSFGTVYGLKHESRQTASSNSGFLLRRGNESLAFIPIPTSDIPLLEEMVELTYISPKVESLGDTQALGELLSASSGSSFKFHGALGIDVNNEHRYVDLANSINGNLPTAGSSEELVISSTMARYLNLKIGDMVKIYIRGIGEPLQTARVVGVFDDTILGSLKDLDGRPLLPSRLIEGEEGLSRATCNASDVFMMDWRGLLDLQLKAESLQPRGTPQLAAISRVAFTPQAGADLGALIRRLTFIFGYVVDVVKPSQVETYYLGYFYEAKGAVEIIIPIAMVVLNVGAIMLNAVYERHNEMKTLTLLGLNPVHIGSIFVAEAIVVGLIGGGLGYVVGLGFQRLIVLFGQDLMVRSKIEWWWSFIGLALSIAVSVLSSSRAAAIAVRTYTPSMVKRVKVAQEEKEKRKEEMFKVFQAREVSLPVRLHPVEVDFFTSYVISRLSEMKSGIVEKVEDLEEMMPEKLKEGGTQKGVSFKYLSISRGKPMGTSNKILCIQDFGKDYFRVSLLYEPTMPGVPESLVERTIEIVKDVCYSWVKEKDKIVVGFR